MKESRVKTLRTKIERRNKKLMEEIKRQSAKKIAEVKGHIDKVYSSHKRRLDGIMKKMNESLDEKISSRKKTQEKLRHKLEKLSKAVCELGTSSFEDSVNQLKAEMNKKLKSAMLQLESIKKEQDQISTNEINKIEDTASKTLENSIKRIS